MNKTLYRSIAALAALGLVVGCNTSKKEITKDQEDRVNGVESGEAKNKETSEQLTADVASYTAKKKIYDKNIEDINQRIASIDERESKVKDNESRKKLIDEREELLAQREATATARDQDPDLGARLERINTAHKILETDGEAYYNGLLTRLADGKDLGMIFTITSKTQSERDQLSAKIISLSSSLKFKFQGHVINDRNTYASTDFVMLNKPQQLKEIHELASTLNDTKLFFYEVVSGRIRSVLTVNYNYFGGSFSRTLQEGPSFEIGSKIGTVDLINPVTQAGFPSGCKPNLGVKCLSNISKLLDKTIKDVNNTEVSLKTVLHEEIKVSRFNMSVKGNYRGGWSPAAPYSFTGMQENRWITSINLSHVLLLDGPEKNDLRLNGVASQLLDKQNPTVPYAGIKAPLNIPGSIADLNGLLSPDYSDRLSKLDSVLTEEE